jgi:TolA-binding protein
MIDAIALVLIFGMVCGTIAIASIFQNGSSSANKLIDMLRDLKAHKAVPGQPEVEQLRLEVRALTQQIAQLRETSTQYDLSIQETLDESQRRLARLENRSMDPAAGADSCSAGMQRLGR